MKTDNTELFEHTPVSKAVITLIIPTVISQIITVIYNMADTFFIGQMNDPNQVAAATLAMPPFVMLTGIANLFGIGGSSLISRSLGTRDREKAKKCAAFSIRSAVSFLYGVVVYLIRPVIFRLPLQGQYCCLSAQSRWYRDLLAVRRRLHTVSIFSGLSVLPVWQFR